MIKYFTIVPIVAYLIFVVIKYGVQKSDNSKLPAFISIIEFSELEAIIFER